MTSALRIARLAGVEIRAHWSLLVVAALLVWSLSDGVFPESNPGLSGDAYLAMAAVAAFLFLVSILLHELGHAVQARREGVAVGGTYGDAHSATQAVYGMRAIRMPQTAPGRGACQSPSRTSRSLRANASGWPA